MIHTSPANITQNTSTPKQNYSETFFLQETTVLKNPEIQLLHIKVAVDRDRNSSSVQRVPAVVPSSDCRDSAAATAAGGQKKKTIFGVPVCRSVAASEKRKNTSPLIRGAKQTLYRFSVILSESRSPYWDASINQKGWFSGGGVAMGPAPVQVYITWFK